MRALLIVLAAASLTESFGALERAFEARHPDVDVEASFGGSAALVAQIRQGAPADVVATADPESMRALADAGSLAGAPRTFAHNRLALAVEAGNPKRVRELADLARSDLIVVLAAEQVPAGRYAREALARAGVVAKPRSLEENVKAVVAKIGLGEADAGIVYETDGAPRARIGSVAIPDEANVVASYPIAVLADAKQPERARAFVAFALSPEGQEVLRGFGFAAP
jgi:molybdate transport system substrate-binding protein